MSSVATLQPATAVFREEQYFDWRVYALIALVEVLTGLGLLHRNAWSFEILVGLVVGIGLGMILVLFLLHMTTEVTADRGSRVVRMGARLSARAGRRRGASRGNRHLSPVRGLCVGHPNRPRRRTRVDRPRQPRRAARVGRRLVPRDWQPAPRRTRHGFGERPQTLYVIWGIRCRVVKRTVAARRNSRAGAGSFNQLPEAGPGGARPEPLGRAAWSSGRRTQKQRRSAGLLPGRSRQWR